MDAFYARNALDNSDTLVHRLVGEPGRTDKIADRVNAGGAGLSAFVDDAMRPVAFDPRTFKAQVFDVAHNADRKDNAIDREVLGLAFLSFQRRPDDAVGYLQAFHRRGHPNLHALPCKRSRGELGDLFV